MIKKLHFYIFIIAALFLGLTFFAGKGLGYEYIDITSPSLRKIPLAMPAFKVIGKGEMPQKIALDSAKILEEALDFTGYFEIMDPKFFSPNQDTDYIQFNQWTDIGAEMLIIGAIKIDRGDIEITLKIYDTIRKKLIIGKKYTANLKYQRKIMHKFGGEVIRSLTGKNGIFESEIAFVSKDKEGSRIYICEFDGYNPRIFEQSKEIILSPSWSWDGKWIAYTSYTKGEAGLFIKNTKENRGFFVEKSGVKLDPEWVPGRLEFAATLSFAGDQEIYLLTGRGKIIKRLTNFRGIDISPSWSPDGRQMAFVSTRAGSPQIYIKDIKTSYAKRLTYRGRYNQQPSWSPDGRKIAYTSMENNTCDIYVINADGSGMPLRLTRESGSNESPSWSPDGSLIVFSSTREGTSRIYIMTSFGTDQRRLIKIPGEQISPQWSKTVDN